MTNYQPPPIASVIKDGKSRPFWSVMIPAYRPDERFLRLALESVLQQDPGPEQMQIEVVDDCSPGMVVSAMVKTIAGNRVKVSQTLENLGLAGCWNSCIERARGEWVHILHQDDLVFPGFYESLQRGIAANPQVGAAYCRHAYCDENGHWHRLSILEMPSPGVLPRFVGPIVSAERLQCAAIAVRRATYERLGGFNSALKHALDWEMWIRIANKFPIFYEPKILACWRNHSGATTSKQIRSGENIRDIAKAIAIWSSYLPESEAQPLSAFANNFFAHMGLGAANYLMAQNDIEASLNQVKAALVCKKSIRLRWGASKLYFKAFSKSVMKRIRPQRGAFLKENQSTAHTSKSGGR